MYLYLKCIEIKMSDLKTTLRRCVSVCEDGFYSTGCAMACGGCLNYTACDKSTGVCFQGI